MPRIPVVSPAQLWELADDPGLNPTNAMRTLANAPTAFPTFKAVSTWVRQRAALDPRLRELAILQVGYAAKSAYVFSHHLKIAPGEGVVDADIHDIVAESHGIPSGAGATELAVLRAAREMTLDVRLSEDTWQELQAALGAEVALELLLIISYYNHNVRWMAAVDLELEPDYAVLLEGWWPPAPPEPAA